MAFKPGRKVEGDPDLDRLRTILNQTGTSQKNNPLYQFCNELLISLGKVVATLLARLKKLEDASESGNESATDEIKFDYVVLSDGATPIPNPIHDGFGNFIYVPYEP